MKSFTISQPDSGKRIHELCERIVKDMRSTGKVPDILAMLAECFPPDDVDNMLYGLTTWAEATLPDVMRADKVKTEIKLGVTFKDGRLEPCDFDDPECWLHGVIDRLDTWADTMVIHDYKTGWSGHDKLQGLIYSILTFANFPTATECRVVYENPIRGYVSPAYTIEWDNQKQAHQLLATIQHIRKGLARAVSYSGLSCYYRCPMSLLWHCSPDAHEILKPDLFPEKPNLHCGWCEGWKACQVAIAMNDIREYPDTIESDAEAKYIMSRVLAARSIVDKGIEMLKAWTAKDDGHVQVGDKVMGWFSSDPKPKVRDMQGFMDFVTTTRNFDSDDEPLMYDPNKVLQVKTTKAAVEAVKAFLTVNPDGGELASGSLRFQEFSEGGKNEPTD